MSFIGKATKTNPVWTKRELLAECARLNIECSSKLTKQELVDLLTDAEEYTDEPIEESEEESSEESVRYRKREETLCELPKDVRFKIMSELPIKDLNSLCRSSKKCSEICQREDFWRVKFLDDYPEYVNILNTKSAKEAFKKYTMLVDLHRKLELNMEIST